MSAPISSERRVRTGVNRQLALDRAHYLQHIRPCQAPESEGVSPCLQSNVVSMCDPIKNSRLQFLGQSSQSLGMSVMCSVSERGAKVLE